MIGGGGIGGGGLNGGRLNGGGLNGGGFNGGADGGPMIMNGGGFGNGGFGGMRGFGGKGFGMGGGLGGGLGGGMVGEYHSFIFVTFSLFLLFFLHISKGNCFRQQNHQSFKLHFHFLFLARQTSTPGWVLRMLSSCLFLFSLELAVKIVLVTEINLAAPLWRDIVIFIMLFLH